MVISFLMCLALVRPLNCPKSIRPPVPFAVDHLRRPTKDFFASARTSYLTVTIALLWSRGDHYALSGVLDVLKRNQFVHPRVFERDRVN